MMILITLLSIALCIVLIDQPKFVRGASFSETLFFRLQCYGEKPPDGCTEDFIEHHNMSWSFTETTKATSHFYLFTNENQEVPELMHKCPDGLPPKTKFNPNYPTVIYLPGFVSGICNFAIYRELKNAYFKRGCYNVILADWMWGNSFDLILAVKNEKIIARHTATLIKMLKEKYGLTKKDFTLVGHSLGAYIAAFVGQMEPVGTIYGMDPAGVIVTKDTPPDERLDESDADCVVVVHCNAGQCLPGYFGVDFPCGTVDFWINGGLHQWSCVKQTMESFLKQDFIFATLSLYPAACSHFQCLQYYKAAIFPSDCQFVGVKCNSQEDFDSGKCRSCGENGENCAVMGPETCHCLTANQTSQKPPRNYYLNTSMNCPFCNNDGIDLGGFSCKPPSTCKNS